jgi:hypothetical protein
MQTSIWDSADECSVPSKRGSAVLVGVERLTAGFVRGTLYCTMGAISGLLTECLPC